MKKFRDLKRYDRIIIKKFITYKDCNVTIDGHKYVQECFENEVVGVITCDPHLENVQQQGKLFQLQITVPQLGLTYLPALNDSDLDKIENDRYKIPQ